MYEAGNSNQNISGLVICNVCGGAQTHNVLAKPSSQWVASLHENIPSGCLCRMAPKEVESQIELLTKKLQKFLDDNIPGTRRDHYTIPAKKTHDNQERYAMGERLQKLGKDNPLYVTIYRYITALERLRKRLALFKEYNKMQSQKEEEEREHDEYKQTIEEIAQRNSQFKGLSGFLDSRKKG